MSVSVHGPVSAVAPEAKRGCGYESPTMAARIPVADSLQESKRLATE